MNALRWIVPAAVVMATGVGARAGDQILVPGKPALTQSVVDEHRVFVEWVFNRKLNETLRPAHKDYYVARWRSVDPEVRSGMLQAAESWKKRGQLSLSEQAWSRTWARATLLHELCVIDDPALYNALATFDKSDRPRHDPDRDKVLVPGSSLTQRVVDQVSEYIEWALAVELTRREGIVLQEFLIDEVKRGDKQAIHNTMGCVRMWERVSRLSASDQRLVQAAYSPPFVAALKVSKDKCDRWLLGIYQAAYPVLAIGDPPLTRFTSDAQAELFCFQHNQAVGKQVWVADRAFKDSYAQRTAAAYAQAGAAEKRQMQHAALDWQVWRAVWPAYSETQRNEWRMKWAKLYQPLNLQAPTASTPEERLRTEMQLNGIRHSMWMGVLQSQYRSTFPWTR
jgi:hypothetical protein